MRLMKSAILLALFVGTSLLAQTAAPKAPAPAAKPKGPVIPADAQWHDVTTWGVEGRGWGDQERLRWFDRFLASSHSNRTLVIAVI